MSRKPAQKQVLTARAAFSLRADRSASRVKVVNTRELCSIKAMTAYVAHNQNICEQTVRAFVEAQFSVEDIAKLNRDDFERVIAFLVDLNCEQILN